MYRRKSSKEQTVNDKLKRLRKAIDEKSMKVLNYVQNEQDRDNILKYSILGSTGSIYNVNFEKGNDEKTGQMSCSCPDHENHKSYCKHIYLVYLKIFNIMPDLNVSGNTITNNQFELLNRGQDLFLKKMLEKNNKNDETTTNNDCRMGPEDECPICFDLMGNQPLFSCKTCKNGFHHSCIQMIFKYNSKCPMCRSNIKNNEDDSENEKDEDVDALTNRIRSIYF